MDSEPSRRPLLRQVLVPAEHGGWAFLAEPILLGLLIAPSWAGALMAAAATAAFLARRPLRIAVSDRQSARRYPRTTMAWRSFAGMALLAAAALAWAVVLARGPLLLAVGLAAPIAAVALAFDLGRRPREAVAELAAALALGASSAGIALAAGWSLAPAFTLWGIAAARSLPTVLFVRSRVRLDRGVPAGIAAPIAAHTVAVAAAAWLAWRGLAPWAAIWAMALLLARAALGLSRWRPRWTTKQLGLSEVALGLLTVAIVAAGWRR